MCGCLRLLCVPVTLGADITPSIVYPFRHHGSKTIRRSLDVLSKHCDTMQKERDDLHRALVKKEEEISNLLR